MSFQPIRPMSHLCCFCLAWKTVNSQSILIRFFLETRPNNPCFLQSSTENGYHAGKRPFFLGSKDRCNRLPSKRYKESQQNRRTPNEDRCKRLYSKRYNYSREVPMHHRKRNTLPCNFHDCQRTRILSLAAGGLR
jgi:hypothetical protein